MLHGLSALPSTEETRVPPQTLLVTGGAGFIGANFVHIAIAAGHTVINLDALTYAGNPENLADLASNPRHIFIHGDIADAPLLTSILTTHQPSAILHFAAESHVDRSILGPEVFLRTNILGTFTLLEGALAYWRGLPQVEAAAFRFLHVSTDEVYGSLSPTEAAFRESTPYAPNSPYSASKAASDHLVRAWHHTFGLPVLTTNCSNNYGPFQFPEKLIPLMMLNALAGKPLPVYGDGLNVRDWLFVEDHCEAILTVLHHGRPGQTYNIGGLNEQTNIAVVSQLCEILDRLQPTGAPHASLIRYVPDRPGHDRRYAIDCTKIQSELKWHPAETFATGLEKTVRWYLDHPDWVEHITSGDYRHWLNQNYTAAGR
jgi:dTDP-glucose 4,6-dehydratase